MRRPFLGLLTALVIVPVASRGQDAPTRACDLAAASPYDLTRLADTPGVIFDKVDPIVALPVCQAALAADPENPRLLFQMGRILQANKDDAEARTFYEKAAAQGHAGAQNNLGVFYTNGRGGLPKNEEEAVRLYKLAADQGELNSQYAVGSFYATGRGGLPKNDEEAARLFKLTADRGIASAQNYLGIFYETSRGGLTKNDQEAARLYKLAADQGHANGQYNLGRLYATGRGGLPNNDEEATRLFKLAADQGNASAQNYLGFFYAFGRGGLPKDDQEAARLYKLAADQGNAAAQYDLGAFYATGRGGLPKNDEEATRLFKLAADNGNSDAQIVLKQGFAHLFQVYEGHFAQAKMAFYFARGTPDACGQGCNEWIAADGFLDEEAAERLRALLGHLHGKNPPIFFNSNGGSQSQAIAIGRIIRSRGMMAGVWTTVPANCAKPGTLACRNMMQSGDVMPAELGRNASCLSSCVFALLGGTNRQVPPSATLAVHSTQLTQIHPDGTATPLPLNTAVHRQQWAAGNDALRNYIQEMGINKQLFELIMKTPNEGSHVLTRDEIVAFGIDVREWSCSASERCVPPGATASPSNSFGLEPANQATPSKP